MKKLKDYLFQLPRSSKSIILIMLDAIVVLFTLILSIFLNENYQFFFYNINNFKLIVFTLPLILYSFYFFELYTIVIRYASIDFAITLLKCVFTASFIIIIASNIFNIYLFPLTIFIFFFLTFLILGSIRLIIRLIYFNIYLEKTKRIAIFGTEKNGRILLRLLNESHLGQPILFFDTDINMIGNKIEGLKVFSLENNIDQIDKQKIDVLYITKKVDLKKRGMNRYISKTIENKPIQVKILNDNLTSENFFQLSNNLKPLSIEKLIHTNQSNKKFSAKYLLNKNILITGAGGSIGSELSKQIVLNKPKTLLLLDHSEYFLYKTHEEVIALKNKFNLNVNIKFFLGSIQNTNFLNNVFYNNKIQMVFHAAAYKHVPILEQNIIEGVCNNVFGTDEIIKASIKFNVSKFLLISSDKAVRPSNIMGATKRLAELLCHSYNTSKYKTKFSVVRFGNVMNSSGSVIPLFKQQISNGGPVTVTDKNVERFFMSTSEAIKLVLKTIEISKGGEIFLLDMGRQIKILDLAKKMIHLSGYNFFLDNQKNKKKPNQIEIKFVGLRSGEKMSEELSLNKNLKASKIKGILVTNEKVITYKAIKKILTELKAYCNNSDSSNIIETLRKAPLDFKSNID